MTGAHVRSTNFRGDTVCSRWSDLSFHPDSSAMALCPPPGASKPRYDIVANMAASFMCIATTPPSLRCTTEHANILLPELPRNLRHRPRSRRFDQLIGIPLWQSAAFLAGVTWRARPPGRRRLCTSPRLRTALRSMFRLAIEFVRQRGGLMLGDRHRKACQLFWHRRHRFHSGRRRQLGGLFCVFRRRVLKDLGAQASSAWLLPSEFAAVTTRHARCSVSAGRAVFHPSLRLPRGDIPAVHEHRQSAQVAQALFHSRKTCGALWQVRAIWRRRSRPCSRSASRCE